MYTNQQDVEHEYHLKWDDGRTVVIHLDCHHDEVHPSVFDQALNKAGRYMGISLQALQLASILYRGRRPARR